MTASSMRKRSESCSDLSSYSGSSDSEEVPLMPAVKRSRSGQSGSTLFEEEPLSPTSTTDLWQLMGNTSIDLHVQEALSNLGFPAQEQVEFSSMIPSDFCSQPCPPVESVDIEDLLWQLLDTNDNTKGASKIELAVQPSHVAKASSAAMKGATEQDSIRAYEACMISGGGRKLKAVGAPSQKKNSSSAGSGLPHNRKEWLVWEDDTIERGVRELGLRWRAIAARLPGRSDDAVRNRWARLQGSANSACLSSSGSQSNLPKLAPPAKQKREGSEARHSWTAGEDAIITNSVTEWGRRWNRIAERLPNRTEHAIRNRWHRLQMAAADEQQISTVTLMPPPPPPTHKMDVEPRPALDLDDMFVVG